MVLALLAALMVLALLAAHRILQSTDRVLHLACGLVGLASVSSFLSPKTFPAASFTAPLACSAEPLLTRQQYRRHLEP
jgi:hypothetical protein